VGFIYSNFTQALGFLPNSDEGKVEALAAYSTEAKSYLYNQLIESTLITNEGIDFDIEKVKKFYDKNFLKEQISLLGKENFSGAVQTWLEDTVVSYLNLIHDKNKINNLCLSGGVTSNIKLNLQIYERTPFKNLYIFPAMGDEGVAAGAAILNAIENKEDISWLSKIEVPYFGDVISKESIFKELTKHKNLDYIDLGDNWVRHAAVSLMEKKIIAIVHGKMEFGPRTLGNRSILANPLDRKSRDKLNQKIKKRDNFQPFCPSILEEERNRFFKHSFKNKTMTSAFRMFPQYQNKLSSAIHIDGTARPQFVEEIDNKSFYGILKHFKELSGFGILINTSFNLHGRTIVRTAEEALTDFKDCDIDLLYLEGILIKRKDL
jgi:carbamoyltransferase